MIRMKRHTTDSSLSYFDDKQIIEGQNPKRDEINRQKIYQQQE